MHSNYRYADVVPRSKSIGADRGSDISLDPSMPAIDAYCRVLTSLAKTIDANRGSAIADTDPEFLHKFRVAIRRTRSILTQGKDVLPPAIVNVMRPRFAWLGSQTTLARDLDVMQINWNDYTISFSHNTLSALEPVKAQIELRRKHAYETMRLALYSDDALNLMTTWAQWLCRPNDKRQGPLAQEAVGSVVAKRLDRAQKVILDHGGSILVDTPVEKLHDLRKDTKKLRYLLDCFSPLLPVLPAGKLIGRLKVLQENLGDHQDSVIHADYLRSAAADLQSQGARLRTLLAVGQLIERLDQRRITARSEFSEQFSYYDSKQTRRAVNAVVHRLNNS